MEIAVKIDNQSVLPKGMKIVQMLETKAGMIVGLGEDTNLYAQYNGEWCRFTMDFNMNTEEAQAAEAAQSEVEVVNEAQVEPEAEAAPAEAEAA